jgi:hypothetical protein
MGRNLRDVVRDPISGPTDHIERPGTLDHAEVEPYCNLVSQAGIDIPRHPEVGQIQKMTFQRDERHGGYLAFYVGGALYRPLRGNEIIAA